MVAYLISRLRIVVPLLMLLLLSSSAPTPPPTEDGASQPGFPRPLKVAYLHFTLQPGGVERHILNLVRSLDPARVVPTVILTRANSSTALRRAMGTYAEVVYVPAQHQHQPGRLSRDPAGFMALVAYLRRSAFDVAFSFYCGGVDDMVGLDAAAVVGVPVAVAYVGWTVTVPPGLPIDALELPSDRLVALQQRGRQGGAWPEVPDHYRLARINSPLDLEVFSPAAVRARLANGGGGPAKPAVRAVVVGRVSRLVLEKNPHTFVYVAARVRSLLRAMAEQRKGEAAEVDSISRELVLLEPRFVLAGDGPLRADLEALAQAEGVADLVEFPGAIRPEEVPAFLHGLDVFLYPTFGDSFGYVVAEAMAMGLPVVATQVGSIPELVDNGTTGFLVRPHWQAAVEWEEDAVHVVSEDFVDEMARRVVQLVTDAALRRRFGRAGRQRLQRGNRVSPAAFAAAHASLYEELYWRGPATTSGREHLPKRIRRDAAEWAARTASRVPWHHLDRPDANDFDPTEHQHQRRPSREWWGDGYSTYLVNLDRSPDRLSRFLADAQEHGLPPSNLSRVRAIDGRRMVRAYRGNHYGGDDDDDDALNEEEEGSVPIDAFWMLDQGGTISGGDRYDGSGLSVRVVNLNDTVSATAANLAVSLSHLKVMRTAYDNGDEVALVLEDDVSFEGVGSESPEEDENGCAFGVGAVLQAARGIDDWTVLQVGFVPEVGFVDSSDALATLRQSWRRGLALVPRLPCGNADWRVYGLHAYLVHRRGMRLLLDAWWPGGAAANAEEGQAGQQQRLDFDLRLAGRIFSESIILNLPGVYTATRPLFRQRRDVTSDTHVVGRQRHSQFMHQAQRGLDEAYASANDQPGEYDHYHDGLGGGSGGGGGVRGGMPHCALGVQYAPPPLVLGGDGLAPEERAELRSRVRFRAWLEPDSLEDFWPWDPWLEPALPRSSPWRGPPYQPYHTVGMCPPPSDAAAFKLLDWDEQRYCRLAAFASRALVETCLPSGGVRSVTPADNYASVPSPVTASAIENRKKQNNSPDYERRPYISLAAALAEGHRVDVMLYLVEGQPQVAIFKASDLVATPLARAKASNNADGFVVDRLYGEAFEEALLDDLKSLKDEPLQRNDGSQVVEKLLPVPLSTSELAEWHCAREAQLSEEQCQYMRMGFTLLATALLQQEQATDCEIHTVQFTIYGG